MNTELIKLNLRVGLELPQKILTFEEGGKPKVAFLGSEFLAARHGISNLKALERYDASIDAGLLGVSGDLLAPVGNKGVILNYGIDEMDSDYSFGETISRLKKGIMSQSDTVWFGEIDFQAEAASQGQKLPKVTLLLFGGPRPGGIAMKSYPKLGLDAFCQKLLVFEKEGAVKIIFNEVKALANLHYRSNINPHEVIDARLKETFKSAVSKEGG